MTVNKKLLQKDPVLNEMVRRLVDTFHPHQIYLFGSRARGEQNPDSDYDMLMIVERANLPRYKMEQAGFRALWGVGASKDLIVLTREEFERKHSVASSLPATVAREGQLLYAA